MDQKKYLRRINYKGDPNPTLEVLKVLQKNHLLSVPFENLDIHFNRLIKLDVNKIFDKIVDNNRGGFCYELNGLFSELLKSIGFKVKRVSARVYDKTKGFGPEYDHMAIIAEIDGIQYLTDVGFGEFIFHPLRIEPNEVQSDQRGEFRLERYDGSYLQVSQRLDDKWSPVYIFSLNERPLGEYEGMCEYHQTSAESHFTQKRLCSLPNEEGRITLTGNDLKIKNRSGTTEILVKDEQDFRQSLWDYFSVKI